jgi:hypothetical protein
MYLSFYEFKYFRLSLKRGIPHAECGNNCGKIYAKKKKKVRKKKYSAKILLLKRGIPQFC